MAKKEKSGKIVKLNKDEKILNYTYSEAPIAYVIEIAVAKGHIKAQAYTKDEVLELWDKAVATFDKRLDDGHNRSRSI